MIVAPLQFPLNWNCSRSGISGIFRGIVALTLAMAASSAMFWSPATTVAQEAAADEAKQIDLLLNKARSTGNAEHGAEVFASPRFACISCHRVAEHGGAVGPELTEVGVKIDHREIAESILWPRKKVKEGYKAIAVATKDGRILQGYPVEAESDANTLALKDASAGTTSRIPRTEIEETREEGSLMPEGLLQTMTDAEQKDVLRFLLELGGPSARALTERLGNLHEPAPFTYEKAPLRPESFPDATQFVNRDRIYDFYTKEADFFSKMKHPVRLVPEYPGLDGGVLGHWGNQSDATWADDRWNRTDLGTLISGVFRGAGVTVPKGVCVRLGDTGELSACFNPETLCYEAVWEGKFVKFSATRHGLMDGLIMDGTARPRPEGKTPTEPFVYHGFYRHGGRVVFSYRIGNTEYLDAPWVENGQFVTQVEVASKHPLAGLTHGGKAQWPQVLKTRQIPGAGRPYAVDTFEPPFENPWNALMFMGDHDFLPDGSALVATILGDVWHVSGLEAGSTEVRWRRFAAGLHQALGLVVQGGEAYVLGRDQITRLKDLDHDGEADLYENFSNVMKTSPAGHDFTCGLERDAQGRFYTSSGPQGVIRISADGQQVETIATGFRNPDGLGLAPDGTLTVPCSEGEWTPTSMICEIKQGGHYGYQGPKPDQAGPDLPLVYIPRGLDNSAGGQVYINDDRFGPLKDHFIHLSFGAGTAFLLLRDQVSGQPQGAVVPLPWEFRSGVHRGRVNPKDGQLYVSGMTGWGTYTPADGCFQRVRYTGDHVQVPIAWRAHENGVQVTFSEPLPPPSPDHDVSTFAQAWNYRYGPGYGSSELSPTHPGVPGHDVLSVRSIHRGADGRSLFIEIPDLQPVNQLHLFFQLGAGVSTDLFATVHKLAPAYQDFPGFTPEAKTIAAHPIEADLLALRNPPPPNPWRTRLPNFREIKIETGKNLSYTPRTIRVNAGETITRTLLNPDVVPHNWALIRPGSLHTVGDLLNKIISQPDAALKQYIPKSDDVLFYTDIVNPHGQTSIFFQVPAEKGVYPFLCSFPGHWKVMNGEFIVE